MIPSSSQATSPSQSKLDYNYKSYFDELTKMALGIHLQKASLAKNKIDLNTLEGYLQEKHLFLQVCEQQLKIGIEKYLHYLLKFSQKPLNKETQTEEETQIHSDAHELLLDSIYLGNQIKNLIGELHDLYYSALEKTDKGSQAHLAYLESLHSYHGEINQILLPLENYHHTKILKNFGIAQQL